ncbi:hypothetical protein JXO59_07015 [candidate division KSB1 bacterium]|nr:hypothetical protein [candidate division KSB1 bacterium]
MKKYFNLCAFFLVLILLFIPAYIFSQTKPKIAVLSLEAKNVSQETADAVADILSTELFNSQRFQVIERQAMLRVLEEQKLQMTGVTDMTQAVEIGKVLNVQKIMIGSVSKLGSTYIINTRLVDVKTGALELAQNAKSTTGEAGLTTAISDLVRNLAQKVAVEGSIIKIDGQDVLIDLGKNHGLFDRQELAVVREGEAITDLSGKVLGRSEDVIGSLRVVSAKPDYSETQVASSKTSFRLGDKVRVVSGTVKVDQPEQPPPQRTRRPVTIPRQKPKETKAEPPPVF